MNREQDKSMKRSELGFQLVDLVVTLSVAGLALLAAAAPLGRMTGRLRVRLAAAEIVGAMREARAFAIRHSEKVGLKFRTEADGAVWWALYRDGDGDGVRTADIDSGVDPLAAPRRNLAHFGRGVRFGFPPGSAPTDPSDPRRRLDRLDDPLRFNRSDIASFSPLEGSTPGSIYLTDGVHYLAVVRVDNRSGRARVLFWDAASRRWT
jgi:hypothetical protein